jgi:hypothetical protein
MARMSSLAPAYAAANQPLPPYREAMPLRTTTRVTLRLVAAEASPVPRKVCEERRYPGVGIAIALGFSAAVWSLALSLAF